MGFPGGSAFTFARDIGDGYQVVTDRTFKSFNGAELDQLLFELDRNLREIRGENAPADDIQEIQARNRKIQRLNTALMVLRNFRQKSRR